MCDKDKIEKLSKDFMALSEEGKQYTLAVVDALAYATALTKDSQEVSA
ncbi:MAG: hypothetical protein FWG61_00495 [Firmicutes bacterium]|nr:hypothetical protein [Bacillota bacterium]